MSPVPRDVIHTERYEKELRAVYKDVKRADEFIRGTEWEICRYPESGEQHGNVWGKPITDLPDQPPLVLYYTFNDNFIWLMSIKKFNHRSDVKWLD